MLMNMRVWTRDGQDVADADHMAVELGPVKVWSADLGDELVILPRRNGTLGERLVLDTGYLVQFQGFSIRVLGYRDGKKWEMLLTPIPTPDADSNLES